MITPTTPNGGWPLRMIRFPVAGMPWYAAVCVMSLVQETAALSPSLTVAWKVIFWSEKDSLRPCMKPT